MSSTFTFRLSYENITMWQVRISLKPHEDVNSDGDASLSASDDDGR